MLRLSNNLLNLAYCTAGALASLPYCDIHMEDFDNMYDGCAFE